MEASGALADGGQGQQQQGGDGGQGGEGFNPAQLVERFDALDNNFEQWRQDIDAQLGQLGRGGEGAGQQQQQDGGELELYLNESGQFEDANGNPFDIGQLSQQQQQDAANGQLPQGLSPEVLQGLQNGFQATLQRQLAPVLEAFQDRQAEDLLQKYPAFQDNEYVDKIVDQAEDFAERYGLPDLSRNVGFLELLHYAEIGRGRQGEAGQMGDAFQGQGAEVETGAASAAGGGGQSLEERIDQRLNARVQSRSIFDG